MTREQIKTAGKEELARYVLERLGWVFKLYAGKEYCWSPERMANADTALWWDKGNCEPPNLLSLDALYPMSDDWAHARALFWQDHSDPQVEFQSFCCTGYEGETPHCGIGPDRATARLRAWAWALAVTTEDPEYQ